jgi:hypothetical protein
MRNRARLRELRPSGCAASKDRADKPNEGVLIEG